MSQDYEYGRKQFPYAGIFEDLTDVANSEQLPPLHAYIWYQQQKEERGLRPATDYFSTSITSGGHARRPDLESREMIDFNTRNARQMLGELAVARVITPERVILPVDLGYVRHWRQSDFIILWLAVIGGLKLGKAKPRHEAGFFEMRLADELAAESVDLELMNSQQAMATERAPEYFKFTRAFSKVMRRKHLLGFPVHRLVNLIDPKDSLGCRTERIFAHSIGVPVYNIGVSTTDPDPHSIIENYELHNDLDTIVHYGGTTVELLPDKHFVLRQSETVENLDSTP